MYMYIYMYVYIYLVGGLEHEFYDFPYIGKNHPNWQTHIFQRDWNHQPPTRWARKSGS